MPLGLFSTGHSTQLGAAVTPAQANHVLEPLHRSTWIFFFPLEEAGGTVNTKKHFLCPSVSR